MKKAKFKEGWTWKMKFKMAIVTVVGWFNPKGSWHVAHKIFTKEELKIMDVDLSFLDNYKKK